MPTVNAIAPKAPTAENLAMIWTIPKNTPETPSIMVYTGLPLSPIADKAQPKSTEISRMHRMLPSASAETNVFGMILIRNSTIPRCCAFSAKPVTAEASSESGFT
ncbi:hypothetical protein D3C81_1989580 [compost metagenome]